MPQATVDHFEYFACLVFIGFLVFHFSDETGNVSTSYARREVNANNRMLRH